LGVPSIIVRHDKKYFHFTKNKLSQFIYKPIIPVVLEAVRDFFWADILSYVHRNEAIVLAVCKSTQIAPAVKGRLFEFLVINASLVRPSRLALENNQVFEIPRHAQRFDGDKLPVVLPVEFATYIPNNENFPAIDFFWKMGDCIVGVQVHISSHHDVRATFEKLCKHAGWTDQARYRDNIYLLYLCSNYESRRDVQDFDQRNGRSVVKVFARTVFDIEGFNTPPWWF
jgi:hypothetical protein